MRTRPAPRSAPLPCYDKTAPDEHSTALHVVCGAQCFWTAIHSLALRSCAAALLLVCTGRHVLTPPPHVYHHRSISLQLRWATAHATKRLRLASAGSGRRSARAACSASAGRCASAPGKADAAVCPAVRRCFDLLLRRDHTVATPKGVVCGILLRALGDSGVHPNSSAKLVCDS